METQEYKTEMESQDEMSQAAFWHDIFHILWGTSLAGRGLWGGGKSGDTRARWRHIPPMPAPVTSLEAWNSRSGSSPAGAPQRKRPEITQSGGWRQHLIFVTGHWSQSGRGMDLATKNERSVADGLENISCCVPFRNHVGSPSKNGPKGARITHFLHLVMESVCVGRRAGMSASLWAV